MVVVTATCYLATKIRGRVGVERKADREGATLVDRRREEVL